MRHDPEHPTLCIHRGALLIASWGAAAYGAPLTLLNAQATQDAFQGAPAPSLQAGEGVVVDSAEPRSGSGQSSLQQTLSVALMTMGVAIMVYILMRNLRKIRRTPHEMDKPPEERVAALRERSDRTCDPQVMIAQTQQIAQRLVTQVEAKAARIQGLLDHAEARLVHYEKVIHDLEARGAALEQTLQHHLQQNFQQTGTQPQMHTPAQPQSHTLSGAGQGSGAAPQRIDPLHQRVHELADQGLDSIEIARRIERPTGQVELILALRRA
jgi:hypothetical protein